MLNIFVRIVRRDLLQALRQPTDVLNPLLFFILVITLFPLAVGPEPQLLARIAPGIIWVAALLSALLGMDRLFRFDYADGSLEQLMLMPWPLAWLVLAKVTVHWLLTGLPLLLITPLVSLLLGLDSMVFKALLLSLLLGTPILSLVGAIGAALTVGVRKGGALLSLLVLPLYIPLLIFATGLLDAASMSMPYQGQLAIIGAQLMAALTLSPLAIAAALKVNME